MLFVTVYAQKTLMTVLVTLVLHVSRRSELENVSHNSACDVIGLVTFVGRVERVKNKSNTGKTFSHVIHQLEIISLK